MIKHIAFDLDGVLLDAKQIHFEALNTALGEKYAISWAEHLSKYDGLKTNQKLEMLSKEKDLPLSQHKDIWAKKQAFTFNELSNISVETRLVEIFSYLSE